MSAVFSASASQIEQVFRDPLTFRSPSYQRRFCWGVAEGGRLLDNLLEAHGEAGTAGGGGESDYFLGTILLVDAGASTEARSGAVLAEPAQQLDIVDGQQRLVTLTILLSVLRDLLVQARPATAAILQGLIGAPSAVSGFAGNRLSLGGEDGDFLAAHVQRPGSCQGMPDEDPNTEAQHCILEIREHFVAELADREAAQIDEFARYLLERCSLVMILTAQIDRAHRMFTVLNDTGKALKRNDILKAELLGTVPAASVNRYLGQWQDLEARLGDEFEAVFSHLRAIHGRSGQQIIAGIRSQVAESGGADRFIDRWLAPAGQALDDIRQARHDGSPHSAEIRLLLGYFNWLPSAEWVVPVMAFWLRAPSDAAGLVALLRGLDQLVMSLRILGHGVDKRAQRVTAVVKAIQAGETMRPELSAFALTRDEQRSVVFNLRDLYARSPQTCKLVLMRINDSMFGGPQGYRPEMLTVEHVLPLKPGPKSTWLTWHRDADTRRRMAASLGNLVLVSKPVNDRARNLDFDRKLKVYFEGDAGPIAHVTQQLRGKSAWKPEDLRDNEIVMLEHFSRIWPVVEKVEPTEVPKRTTWGGFSRALRGRS